jgi:hypothetical protein
MSKVMLVDTLAQSPFAHLEAAYDSAINIRHVRESLVHFIESDDEDDKALFRAFPEYGLRELPDLLADLENLYHECTGTELTAGRGH